MKVNEQVCWVVNQILMEHSAGGRISEGPLLTLVKYSSKLWSGLEFLMSVGGAGKACSLRTLSHFRSEARFWCTAWLKLLVNDFLFN